MRYSPELEREVRAWEEAAKRQPLSQRGAHMLRAPRPRMSCLYCKRDIGARGSAVQTLGMLRGRFWRWHKCPFCQERFVAGVALEQKRYAVGDEIVHETQIPTTTTDVEKMYNWYPRDVYRRMREEEDEQLRAAAAAPAIERELEESDPIDRALMGATELAERAGAAVLATRDAVMPASEPAPDGDDYREAEEY